MLVKAAVLQSSNNLSVKEMQRPRPGQNEVLVKVMACGVCPTDVRKYMGLSSLPGYPFILGHEAAGVIAGLGENVSGEEYQVGDRVVLEPVITCGICKNCKNGNTAFVGVASCLNYGIFGITVDGGFREYAQVPKNIVNKMPDGLSFHEAALAEPVACCLNAVEKAELKIAETVLVIGAGFMGLTHMELAKLKGAKVIISDVKDERLEVARSLGADMVVNPKTEDVKEKILEFNNGEMVDAVMCTVGGNVAFKQGIDVLGHGGRLVIVGGTYPPENICLDPNHIHYEQLKIMGTVSYTNGGFAQTLKLLADGKLSTSVLQSELVPLENLEQAFKDVVDAKGLRKCVVFD